MAKKKNPHLPPDSKAFINSLINSKKAQALSKEEIEHNEENLFLIDTYNNFEKMINHLSAGINILKAIRLHDFPFLVGEYEKRAWEYATYVGNHLESGLRIKMSYMLDPNYADPELNAAAMTEHVKTNHAVTKIANDINSVSWLTAHLVNKKPFDIDPKEIPEDRTKEDVVALKYHNGVCIAAAEASMSACILFSHLKRDVLGKSVNKNEAAIVKKKFYDMPGENFGLLRLSYAGFFYDIYMLLAAKLGDKVIDVKKYTYRTRLNHQMARVGIGINDHAGMTATLIMFWSDARACLEEIKPEFRRLVEEHAKKQLIIIT